MNKDCEIYDFSKEKVEKLRKHAILECYNWWGLRYYGYKGILITDDYELFSYRYEKVSPRNSNNNASYIIKNKKLNKKECKKINKFIECKLLYNDFEMVHMRDAGFYITIKYKGINKSIDNQKDIYAKTVKLLEKIIEKKENFISRFLKRK